MHVAGHRAVGKRQPRTDDERDFSVVARHLFRPHTVGRWIPPETPRSGRLRIGYVSSDLREHAVGFLTAEIFELHDRDAVEVFAYYTGPNMTDATRARIEATVDHWTDISGLGDAEAARRIVHDEIDILVDVNGYTKDGRTKLFARRPAPIIVNWLGFPGTMGTPHHNYIVADDRVIPKEFEKYYTEKVLRLPCYQSNDRRRVVAEHRPSRAEAGLPEDAFVYCCFNGPQKITRSTFGRWMTILKGVPNSVLWLLSSNALTDERLRQLAAQHDVAPERLIFAPKLRNEYHLARYPLADLFLDSAPYGAHTTASDALWMGVPRQRRRAERACVRQS
jgi:predicted O-linked N-acetylglucosamine transferase (SPINDLY family)